MKKSVVAFLLLGLVVYLPGSLAAGTISWVGGSGDWNTAANWSAGVLPGPNDDVAINPPGPAVTVTFSAGNATVQSIQCQESFIFSGGSITVTANASQFNGSFTMSDAASLGVTGPGTSLIVAGPGNIDGAALSVNGGAELSFPGVGSLSTPDGCGEVDWQASGPGSVLNLSGLTNLAGGDCGALVFQAFSGGQIVLSNLVTIPDSYVSAVADGTDSVVDLSGLASFQATNDVLALDARNGGSVLAPKLTDGNGVSLTLEPGGIIPTAQYTNFSGGSLTLSGGALSLPGVSVMDGASLSVSGGAVLSFPGVGSFGMPAGGCAAVAWQASGPGSVLNLSRVTNLSGGSCGALGIGAFDGGLIVLSNVVTIPDSYFSALADGTNSVVDLSGLASFQATNDVLALDARNGGSILAPKLTDGNGVSLTLEPGGIIPTAQYTNFSGGSFTLSGGALSLPGVSALDGASLSVSGGAVLSFPGVGSFSMPGSGCGAVTWQASGPGSVLNLSWVTNLSGGSCGALMLEALAGGQIVLSNVVTIPDSNVSALADGTNSVVDLTGLLSFQANLGNLALDARNGGSILAPKLTDGNGVSLTLEPGGIIPTAQFTNFNGGGVTLSAGALSLPGVSALNGAALSVSGGAVLSFPGVGSFSMPDGCGNLDWQASGAGSVLDLSGVTNLAGGSCGALVLQALAGGQIVLSNLTTILDSNVSALADGTNSVVDLSRLASYWGTNHILALDALDSGSLLAPKLASAIGGTIQMADQLLTNLGSFQIFAGATLNCQGDVTLNGLQSIASQPGGTVFVSGDFLGNTINVDQFTPQGTLELGDGPHSLEVMSRDLGNVPNGYAHNFGYGTILLDFGAQVTLVDQSVNSGAQGPECLYVNILIVPPGSSLDLNGLHLYARFAQIAGNVTNGVVSQLPDNGGPLTLGPAVPGTLAAMGGPNVWTFFGLAGQRVAVTVDTGTVSVYEPSLNYAYVELFDPLTNLLAQASNAASQQVVALTNTLPGTGVYTILIGAPANESASAGNYLVAVWNVIHNVQSLVLNQQANGLIQTPFSADQWNFSAAAGQQIRFDLLNVSAPGLAFTLTGPNGWVGLTNLATSSDLITLPSSGGYTLTANGPAGAYNIAYAFQLAQTAQTGLKLGATFTGSFAGSGQAQLFALNVPASGPLLLTLNNAGANNTTDLYAEFGSPPTRGSFGFQSASPNSSNQQIVIPSAAAGTWYVLVYGDVISTPDAYTISAASAEMFVASVFPARLGNGADAALTLSGAGFLPATTVALVSSGGTTYPARSVALNSFTQLTATFAANTVPPGIYSILVGQPDGYSSELTNSFQFTGGGQGQLATQLLVPSFAGRHEPATIYVQYANVGTAAMPAPLLVVSGSSNPIMALAASLTPEQQQEGFFATQGGSLPAPWKNTVQFLGGGLTPGMLEPGESNMVAIAYAGLQQPWDFSVNTVQFNLGVMTVTNTTPVGWDSLKAGMQPAALSNDVWNVLWRNFTNQMGPTWGAYLTKLDQDSSYFGGLGLNVGDLGRLLAFESLRADGMNVVPTLAAATDASFPSAGLTLSLQRVFPQRISGRFQMGAFGRGWAHNWEMSLSVASDGSVSIALPGGALRRFLPDLLGGYFNGAGDYATLTALGGGAFALQEANGLALYFRPDGWLDYAQDPNGNTITCGYTGTMLTSLTHSDGQALVITYNASACIASVTDPAGRQTTFTYDAAGEHLITAAQFDGNAENYQYTDSATAANNPALAHALNQISLPGGYHRYFTCDNQGRLGTASRDGGVDLLAYTYDSAGTITVTDAGTNSAVFYLDNLGLPSKARNPLGNAVYFARDANLNITGLTDPAGHSTGYAYDNSGNLTLMTDTLGGQTAFAYQGPFNRLASLTDANANATLYDSGTNGNLGSITSPDGSIESWSYNAPGEPVSWTNRRGQAVQFAYNMAGQITQKAYPDGRVINFGYNSHALLATVADSAQGATTLAYDARDFLTNISYPNGGGFAFAYDNSGRRTSRAGSDGRTLNYGYDAAGRAASLTEGATNLLVQYTYDPSGRLVRESKGNGTFTTYTYDAGRHVLSVTNSAPDGAVQSFFNYTYDTRGNRLSMTTAAGVTRYTYDDAYQLTGAAYPGGRQVSYAYDSVGNRTMVSDTGANTVYAVGSLNQYTGAGATMFGYDADGNLTSRADAAGTTSYQYDVENRLINVVTATNGSWQYAYDGLGHRVSAIHNGATNSYLNDPFGLVAVAAEYGSDGSLTAHYDQGWGLVSRSDPSGNTAFYAFDALGNTRQITGGGGAVLNSYDYDAFGADTSVAESVPNEFRFTGRFGAPEDPTGLHFMRARYYDASEGRFTSSDPLGVFAGDADFYRYVNNDPVSLTDPLGLSWYAGLMNGGPDNFVGFSLGYSAGFSAGASAGVGYGYSAGVGPGGFLPGSPSISSGLASAGFGAYGGAGVGVSYGTSLGASLGYSRGNTTGIAIGWGWDGPILPGVPSGSGGGGNSGISDSGDPNQLIGPAGYAMQNYVVEGGLFAYEIIFENETNATAPAQMVQITDPLSTNLDWTTFQLTGISFGNQSLSMPPNARHFQTNLPFSFKGVSFQVQIQAGLNPANGQVFANFFSLDPATGLPPTVDIGFLPPEDGTGRGIGQVSYLVGPKSNLPNGTQISNVASIQFDVNPVIATDQKNPEDPSQGIDPGKEATVTIDNIPPVSSVSALPVLETNSGFEVCWSGTDVGSGIVAYDIYVSTNSGPWTAWVLGTTNSCMIFNGQPGDSYGFYSVAHDGAGNIENPVVGPEAATTVVGSNSPQIVLTDPLRLGNGQFQFTFNSTTGVTFTVQYATNLANWLPLLQLGGLAGSQTVVDTNAAGVGQRFYRVKVAAP